MHWSTGSKMGEEGQQVEGDMGFESKGRWLRKQSLGEVGLKMMMGLAGKMSTPAAAVVVEAVGGGGCNCCSYCFSCCCWKRSPWGIEFD